MAVDSSFDEPILGFTGSESCSVGLITADSPVVVVFVDAIPDVSAVGSCCGGRVDDACVVDSVEASDCR